MTLNERGPSFHFLLLPTRHVQVHSVSLAKYLDNTSRRLAEVQTCLDHLRIVEHNHRTGRYLRGQVTEVMFLNLTLPNQQFALVALLQWIFGNTLFGEVIIVILDL